MNRMRTQPRSLHCRYEKAGLVVSDQPVPWCADAVLVEAHLRLPSGVDRRKADFQLRLAGRELVPAESLRALDAPGLYRVVFRFPTPASSLAAEVLFRQHRLGQLTVPVLTRDDFVRELRVQSPTVFVRLGSQSVACLAFVASQCRGLMASAVLSSPTSLVPLLDLDVRVEFRAEGAGPTLRAPACLCSSQLAGWQALVSVAPRGLARRCGAWVVTWLVAGRPLASQRIRAVSREDFLGSLRVSDTRFVVQRGETVHLERVALPAGAEGRVGPCFLVASSEVGMAGLCSLRTNALVPGAVRAPLLGEQDVLITDGPTVVAPGTLDAVDLAQVSGFELSTAGRVLGQLPLHPAPAAAFDGEGGFAAPEEYAWTAAAEEEMHERLMRLMGPTEGQG